MDTRINIIRTTDQTQSNEKEITMKNENDNQVFFTDEPKIEKCDCCGEPLTAEELADLEREDVLAEFVDSLNGNLAALEREFRYDEANQLPISCWMPVIMVHMTEFMRGLATISEEAQRGTCQQKPTTGSKTNNG